ncbi:shikimate dehydrogenase [Vitiosangium sp. GDMCC 1.1324]|uniref:shikimate dehydrogenase n=1 Tax=Vitiosangium sp. (strain GDMCC 1.1324) TaxID=2138576 RepID=UPI000D343F9B|nr:shikimate dehydrogenase [Vitiosangium sp. GDMCC 1.1324]PTL80769.1 shikimate dehydrogenase [Vitiosangium sp. GDMCC 1.1324]
MTSARRVVTLPPSLRGPEALRFATDARSRGADVLEVRTDLHPAEAVDAAELAKVMDLLVSERGTPLPPAWVAAARWVDRDVVHAGALDAPVGKLLASHHAERPLSTEEALRLWDVALPAGALVKHVEPLGDVSQVRIAALLETQTRLRARFGEGRVTVLAMNAIALPVRAVLARRNVLDYVAVGGDWKAAPGQRLLADAFREARALGATGSTRDSRLAILGTSIAHSRSPRIHLQPFDRIDIPEDAPVEALVDALLPHYRGFAVTSPFKIRLARHTGSPLDAINTLVRRGDRWESFNTDTEGARTVLERLGAREAFVLGDGGASAAIRVVAPEAGCRLRFLRRAEISEPLGGSGIWTWPDRITPPDALRFEGARVAVIAYGAPARRIAADITRRGGTPVLLGAAWFIAQARRQRALWESAS